MLIVICNYVVDLVAMYDHQSTSIAAMCPAVKAGKRNFLECATLCLCHVNHSAILTDQDLLPLGRKEGRKEGPYKGLKGLIRAL